MITRSLFTPPCFNISTAFSAIVNKIPSFCIIDFPFIISVDNSFIRTPSSWSRDFLNVFVVSYDGTFLSFFSQPRNGEKVWWRRRLILKKIVCYFFFGRGYKNELTCVGILGTHNSCMTIFNKMKSWNQMIKGLHRHWCKLIERRLLNNRRYSLVLLSRWDGR